MASRDIARRIAAQRQNLGRQRIRLMATLGGIVIAGVGLTLMMGRSWTPPLDVLRVLLGQDVAGASFAVGELRLPRAVLSVLTGFSFGLAGASFQTMLRNPLASPDIIGISSGASAAAVFAIVVLGWSGLSVSVLAVGAGLGVALLIYLLSWRDGVAGARLILVGIGLSALLESLIAYILSNAPAWVLQDATRWLTGSVNGAALNDSLPLLLALLLFGGGLLLRGRDLAVMRLGDDSAAALGVPVTQSRALVVVCAVGLISVATATSGPVAFVAFLSGPIATRICGAVHGSAVFAGLIGALLVLFGDFAGQFLLPARYPVGIVTGALGAPYLLYLILRINRNGGTA